jgi:hypothetical protein
MVAARPFPEGSLHPHMLPSKKPPGFEFIYVGHEETLKVFMSLGITCSDDSDRLFHGQSPEIRKAF